MKFLSALLCLFSFLAFSQNETSNWFFGHTAGLRFMPDGSVQNVLGGQVTITPPYVHIREGTASISDANGQLLFYTDGVSVWDRNHLPMPGGSLAFNTRLLGNYHSAQTALIVPHPTQSHLYYIFTVDSPHHLNAQSYPDPYDAWAYIADDGFNNGLNYSLVDMNAMGSNGSIGNVVQRNIHLITYNTDPNGMEIRFKCSEKLAGVKNINDNSYWVMTHFIDSFYAFRIDANGVNHEPVVNQIGLSKPITGFLHYMGGNIKFNLAGDKMAVTTPGEINLNNDGNAELYDFDINTGVLSNLKIITSQSKPNGIEFSPNGNFVYLTYRENWNVYVWNLRQYDITSSDIPNAFISFPINCTAKMQLANNGKIYINSNSQNHLHVINNPDEPGLACNVVANGLTLAAGAECSYGLPNFVSTLIMPPFNIQNFCLGSPTVFGFTYFSTVTNILWSFGDGQTSTDPSPSHTYAAAGTYTVTLTYTINGQIKTQSRTITIHPIPTAQAIGQQRLCLNNNQQTINLKTLYDALILNGQSTTQHQVLYYANQNDFNNNVPINQPDSFNVVANQSYQIYAKVINAQDNNCSAQTNFSLQTFLQPALVNMPPAFICQQPFTGSHQWQLGDFNATLTSNNSLLAVSYYATEQNAEQQLDALPLAYSNSQPEETIYYRLHHTQNTDCFSVGSFQLIVDPQPEAVTPFNWYVCDNNTDGITTVNFNDQQNVLRNGMNPLRYSLSYYLTLSNAQNMTDAISSNFTNTQAQTTVYYRLHNNINNQCMAVGEFTLIVTPQTNVAQPPTQYYCENDTTQALSFQLSDFYALFLPNTNDYAFSFHPTLNDAQNQTLTFPDPYQNSQPQETWHVRIVHNDNPLCVYYSTLNIDIQLAAVAHPVLPLTTCDDDNQTGIANFNLNNKTADILQNQLPTQYQVRYYLTQQDAEQTINPLPLNYTNISNPQIIYTRVNNINATDCYDITPLELIVYPKPFTNEVIKEVICDNLPVILQVPPGFLSYTWNTGSTQNYIIVNQAGQYHVDVVKIYPYGQCSGRLNFDVQASGKAIITNIEKVEFAQGNNQITVNISGLGIYEYSLDGINYQMSPVFSSLAGGHYTVYVRDINDCGVVSQLVYILDAPKFFTPNGDGYSDYWHITSARFSQNLKVFIFDRLGKLIKTLSNFEAGWDGTYNGQLMPSTDYWFVVERPNQPNVKGHFSLKR